MEHPVTLQAIVGNWPYQRYVKTWADKGLTPPLRRPTYKALLAVEEYRDKLAKDYLRSKRFAI